jgi:putative transposase
MNASRERSEARRDLRSSGSFRKRRTKTGEATPKEPTQRYQAFETAIIERYLRRETSVEEALMEMSLAHASVPHVEDIIDALQDTQSSPSLVSRLNQTTYKQIEAWRNRPIEGEHPYLYVDGIVLKWSWAGVVHNVSLLVAISVNRDGHHEILGIVEGAKEDGASWNDFLKHLKDRGLKGVELIISDVSTGLVESAAEFFADARCQRCVAGWYRNVFNHVPPGDMREVASMLRTIHACENRQAAQNKAAKVIARLREIHLTTVAEIAEQGVEETLAYYAFPREHWRRIRTNNPLELIMREIRRRARVVGAFPEGKFALSLAAARLKHIAGTSWSTKRYLNIELLRK